LASIQLGIETYSTISDTISLGQNAAGALITHGVATVVGDVALDQLTGNLSNQAKIAIGMDAASLSKPRTVKIKAVSDAARAAYPDLARVQQSMARSLEAIKAARITRTARNSATPAPYSEKTSWCAPRSPRSR
jgi:hypothetical protein